VYAPPGKGLSITKQLMRLCERLLTSYWPRFIAADDENATSHHVWSRTSAACWIDYQPVAGENFPQEGKPRLVVSIRDPGSAAAP